MLHETRGRKPAGVENSMIVPFLKIFSRLIAELPLPAALALGRFLGRVFGVVVPRNRARAMENLALCFPGKSRAELRGIMWRMFSNLGMNGVETMRWLGGRRDEMLTRLRVENLEIWQEAVDRKMGVPTLSAHIGNWEVIAAWASAHIQPAALIAKDIRNKALNKFINEKRAASNIIMIAAHNSYRQCLRTLKAGGALGFVLDQNMIRREGIFVDFFGRPACTTPGLALLSWQSQAPVLPLFALRQPDGSTLLRFMQPIAPPQNRDDATIAAATQQYTKIIEDVIREFPDQWIWMHRRWRTQPGPEDILNAGIDAASKGG